ncbi:GM20635 [Drosophila sechellia]|uniref:GM20635 n=1 Tax=Drosophila sechellia TaxID=7238 RepID=B4HSE5_DROSE|nr:GM20635 [Drosophila sechellia]
MSENHDSLGASVAYSELVATDHKDIILLMDVESAVSICSACVANKSANPVDVLTLWFTKLLGAYIDESGRCVLAAREMCKWFTIEAQTGNEVNSSHIKLMSAAQEFVSAFRDRLLEAGERLVHILAYLVFIIIDFCLVSDKSHCQVVVDLQLGTLSLVKDSIINSTEVHPRLATLMQKIMETADTEGTRTGDLQLSDKPNVPAENIEELVDCIRSYILLLYHILQKGVVYVDDDVAACLMDLIMCEQTRPSYYSEIEKQQLISVLVRPHVLDILELVYTFQKCQDYLISSALGTPQFDYFDACMDFINAMSTDDADVLPSTCLTLQQIFEYLFKVGNIELHRYFCAGIFQKDFITSQVCADILMLCFRLKEANKCWTDRGIKEAIAYWHKCNNSYAMFSTNPSQLHVQRFLRYFHCLGKQELPVISIQNFRLLSAVAEADDHLGMKILKRLELISSSAPTKIELYYEVVALLELLVHHDQIDCSHWFQRTSEMAKKLFGIDKSVSFANAYFKLLARANGSTQLLILRGLPPNVGCTNWNREKFLDSCKVSYDGQLRAFSARHAIDPLFKALQDVSATVVDGSFDLSKSSYIRHGDHRCPVSSLKRRRSELAPKEILRKIYEASIQLAQCTANFDPADWELHKKVMANLSGIVP